MNGLYIERDGVPVPADIEEWVAYMAKSDRTVAKWEQAGLLVSTVFLGVDYNFYGGKPLVYETMVFGGLNDQKFKRSSSRCGAASHHEEAVNATKAMMHCRSWRRYKRLMGYTPSKTEQKKGRRFFSALCLPGRNLVYAGMAEWKAEQKKLPAATAASMPTQKTTGIASCQ
ncbi:MAG: hypothetical protein WCF45_10435 [Photobacterium halotolerans]